MHVGHVHLLISYGGHQQCHERHNDQRHGCDQALDQARCSGRLAQSVMVFSLEFAVEDEEMKQDGGGREDEKTGGAVAQSAAYEGVEDGEDWQTEGGQQHGEDDADGVAGGGCLPPDQENLKYNEN